MYWQRHKSYKCGFLQTYSVIWWLISIKIIIEWNYLPSASVRTRQKSSSERFRADGGWRTRMADDVCVHIWTLILKVMSAFISISVRGRCVRMTDDVCAHSLNLPSLRNIYIKSGLRWAPHTDLCICFSTKSNSIWGWESHYLYEFLLSNNNMSSLRTKICDALIVPSGS